MNFSAQSHHRSTIASLSAYKMESRLVSKWETMILCIRSKHRTRPSSHRPTVISISTVLSSLLPVHVSRSSPTKPVIDALLSSYYFNAVFPRFVLIFEIASSVHGP